MDALTQTDSPRLRHLVDTALARIRDSHSEIYASIGDTVFWHVEHFLADPNVSVLEKAMYVLLNQFAGDQQEYFVVPRQRVRVPEVYELTPPGYKDYELDFAAYAGSESRFVKIAIECDGIRSHRERHADRDRHKDVNLQAAGWTVIRFGSREIHAELQRPIDDDTHINKFVTILENVVAGQSDALTQRRYFQFVERLTGYTYGDVSCSTCGHRQWDPLEIAGKCRKCGQAIPATLRTT